MMQARHHFVQAMLVAGMLLTSIARPAAAQDAKSDTAKADRRAELERLPSNSPEAKRYVAVLNNLLRAIRSKLDLSKKRRDAVNGLFRTQLRSLRETKGRRRPFGTNPGDREKLEELRTKMTAAREDGDTKTLRTLQDEFRGLMTSRQNVTLSASQFLNNVAAELTEDQQKTYWMLVRQFRTTASPGNRRGGLFALRRIVLSPTLGLRGEARAEVQKMLRDGMELVDDAVRNGGDPTQVAEYVQLDILSKLTPEQRARAQTVLDEDRADRRRHSAERRAKRRDRRRGADGKRSRAKGESDSDTESTTATDPRP